MAEWARDAPERGEHDPALVGRVTVVDEELRHGTNLPAEAAPDIGAHPGRAPWSSARLSSPRGRDDGRAASQLVGRGAAVEGLDGPLDGSAARGPARSSSSASPGSARAACWPSSRRAPTRAATSCCRQRLGVRARPAVLGCSSTRSTTTSGARAGPARRACPPTPWRSCGEVFPSLATAGPRRRRPTSATGPTGPSAGSSRCWRPGAARPPARRRALGGRRLDRPARCPAAPAARRAGADRGRRAPAAAARAAGGGAPAHPRAGGLTRLELGAPERGGGPRAARRRRGRRDGIRAVRRERRQPLLPGAARPVVAAAARSARGHGLPTPRVPGASPRRSPGSSPCCPRPPAACSRAPPWPATRSSSSSPRPPRACPSRPCSPALDELLRRDLVRHRTSRGASASATPSCGAPSTSRPRAAGASARTRPPRRRWPRAAPRRPARTTSSARPGTATPPPSAVLREAAEATVSGAPATAARLLDAALRLAGPDAPDRTGLLAASAQAHALPGSSARPTTACSRAWRPCRGPRRAPACG